MKAFGRSKIRTTTSRRVSLLAVVALALPLAGVGVTNVLATESTTVGPYVIDGTTIPDSDTGPTIVDAFGTNKELGPINGTTTKIGVIHSDVAPTLGLTNPNGQVDLKNVWLNLRRVNIGSVPSDVLYFAWERDANSGSGFIAYEFMRAAAPAACVYSGTPTETSLAGCNPFASRAAGDFMILWDQQGGSRILTKRVWGPTGATGSSLVLGGPELLGANAAAHYSPDGFKGEAAVNLTGAGLTTGSACTTLANTVPSTVTGNSDTADYKDTVLTSTSLTTCAGISIRKVNDASETLARATFTLYNDVAPLGGTRETGTTNTDTAVSPARTCTTGSDGLCSMADVPYGNYWVVESFTPLNHDTAPDQTVVVGAGGSTPALLTFVNARQRGSILWHKRAGSPTGALLGGAGFTVSAALVGGPAGFTSVVTPAAGAPSNTTGVFCVENLLYGTYTVTETTVPAGYNGAAPQNQTVNSSSNCTTRLAAAAPVADLTFVNLPAPGTINVQKNDDVAPTANPLQGAQFTLFQSSNLTYEPLVDTTVQAGPLTTNASGTLSFTNVPLGTYCVVETLTPPGHSTAAAQCRTLGLGGTAGQGQTISLTFVDPRVPGTINILKTDDVSPPNANPLAGAKFTLYVDTNGDGQRQSTEMTVQSGPTASTGSDGRVAFTQVPLGKYCVVETTTPSGYATAGPQCVTVLLGTTAGQGQTIALTFVDPRQHKVIVIVCHEGTATLVQSGVTIGTIRDLQSLASAPSDFTEAQLCGLGGATVGGLPHGDTSASVNIPVH